MASLTGAYDNKILTNKEFTFRKIRHHLPNGQLFPSRFPDACPCPLTHKHTPHNFWHVSILWKKSPSIQVVCRGTSTIITEFTPILTEFRQLHRKDYLTGRPLYLHYSTAKTQYTIKDVKV